jgi:hypothetical protein
MSSALHHDPVALGVSFILIGGQIGGKPIDGLLQALRRSLQQRKNRS